MKFESKEQAYSTVLPMYVGSEARLLVNQPTMHVNEITHHILRFNHVIFEELYLRSYSSMTDAEALEFARLTERHVTKAFYNSGLVSYKHDWVIGVLHIGLDKVTPAQLLWLLKNGFDVFGLIKLGYAKELKQ